MKAEADKYLKAESTVKQLRGVTETYKEAVKKPTCDKKGMGFNRDDRFSAFQLALSFDSYYGYYGNSSCSTVINFSDPDLVKRGLIAYLNTHTQTIFNWIADKIEQESTKEKLAYIESLETELSRLKEATHENPK